MNDTVSIQLDLSKKIEAEIDEYIISKLHDEYPKIYSGITDEDLTTLCELSLAYMKKPQQPTPPGFENLQSSSIERVRFETQLILVNKKAALSDADSEAKLTAVGNLLESVDSEVGEKFKNRCEQMMAEVQAKASGNQLPI